MKAFFCEHTDREHEARGLCKKCYNHAKYAEAHPDVIARGEYGTRTLNAICHPDRPMYRSKDGLCVSCYAKHKTYKVDFLTMYRAQDGNCKLCLEHFTEDELDIDHDHVTNKVRGLVCTRCNILLGWAEHPLLSAALVYLRKEISVG